MKSTKNKTNNLSKKQPLYFNKMSNWESKMKTANKSSFNSRLWKTLWPNTIKLLHKKTPNFSSLQSTLSNLSMSPAHANNKLSSGKGSITGSILKVLREKGNWGKNWDKSSLDIKRTLKTWKSKTKSTGKMLLKNCKVFSSNCKNDYANDEFNYFLNFCINKNILINNEKNRYNFKISTSQFIPWLRKFHYRPWF